MGPAPDAHMGEINHSGQKSLVGVSTGNVLVSFSPTYRFCYSQRQKSLSHARLSPLSPIWITQSLFPQLFFMGHVFKTFSHSCCLSELTHIFLDLHCPKMVTVLTLRSYC